MTIYEPKVINLGETIAITGDKTLIFATLLEFDKEKNKIFAEVQKSFNNLNYDGLCCRADKDTLSVTLIPTTRCNLRCIYCYSDGGFDNKDLSFKYAKHVLDNLMNEYKDSKKINLYFAGGGEPLLNFSFIRDIVQYVRDKGLEPNIRIVTNGTLIEDYLDWLKSNKVYLRISYDGSSQQETRPGIYFDSQKKLHHVFNILKAEYPSDLLSVQMTITTLNVSSLTSDVLKLISQYGINVIKIEPVQSSCSSRSKKVDRPSPKFFVDSFLKLCDSLIKNRIKAYIDTSYLSVPSVGYFCSLRNKIVISPYGLLTPCVEIIKRGVRDNIILWEINKNKKINFQKIREIQKRNLFKYHPQNFKICSNCNLVHICKGNCPMRLILENKTQGPYAYNCTIAKKLIPAFLLRASLNENYLYLVFGKNFEVEEKCD